MKRRLEQGSDGMGETSERGVSRCIWTEAEDKALEEMADKFKGEYWNLVAEHVQKFSPPDSKLKTAKQCRERWHNQLRPGVRLGPLSDAEERKVFALHEKFGNRWSKIASKLPGRTDNVIKNYFLCRLRRIVRCIKKGSVKQVAPHSETELMQTLYLLDYLYKFYVSPERHENIRRSLNSQIKKRRNLGDKYINKIVANEGITVDKLSSFTQSLLATSQSYIEHDKGKLKDYEYLLTLTPNGSSSSSSSLCINSPPLHEDPKCGTFGSASCTSFGFFNNPVSIVAPTEREVGKCDLELPVVLPLPILCAEPCRKYKVSEDDFKPTFFFSVYSLPCLSPCMTLFFPFHSQNKTNKTTSEGSVGNGKCDALTKDRSEMKK